LPFYFFAENIDFNFKKKLQVKKFLKNIIISEGFLPADINVIFCSDEFLLEKNVSYLGKDYLTDIITFNYNQLQFISGDLFISVERVRENALINKVSFDEELIRVIIHGVLHLVGYNDSNPGERIAIREKENFYLESYLK
jgi:probable rRNA maturation factor